MKVIGIQETDLDKCVKAARRQRVVLTSNGKPVALMLGVEGMNLKTIEQGQSAEFWALLRERRGQKKITRQELERRLASET